MLNPKLPALPAETGLRRLRAPEPQPAPGERQTAAQATHFDRRTRVMAAYASRLEARSAQLQRINRELEAFTCSVAHDLRAPLNAISGFARILSEDHRDRLDAEGQFLLDRIARASAHMGRLIDGLLGYARLGRAAVRAQPVALGELLAEVIQMLQPRIAETSARLAVAGDLPAVMGDRTLLHQVFTNLLENALTYRRPGVPPAIAITWKGFKATVEIMLKSATPAIAITWKGFKGHATISVADNGIGIPGEDLERIFDMFQRLHPQDRYPGTGIGLATARKAVELQNGSLRAESQPGAGSTFHVTLALAHPAAPAASGRADGLQH
jgi:signal transduction histidine kinase